MKTLVITKDKSILSREGAAYQELLACSEAIDQVHVIVVTDKKDALEKVIKITDKFFIYPTNSSSSLFAFWDIYKIAKFQMTSQFESAMDLVSTADDYTCAFATYLFCRKFGTNYIINVFNHGLSPGKGDGLVSTSFKNSLSNIIFKNAAGVRVCSQSDGEVVYDRNGVDEKHIYILPYPTNAVEKKQREEIQSSVDIHKNYPQFNLIFLMANQSSGYKTVKRAREIMERLHVRYPRSGLVTLGNIEKSLWHFFFFRNLPEYMVFEPGLENKVQYVRTANVFLDISSSHPAGGALAEAAMSGCPIVASDTEASRGIVREGENGFIADPENPDAFAFKVVEVLEKRGFRERLKLSINYDITEVYGEKVEDYHARLVDIWDKTKSSGSSKLVSQVINPITKTYPAFTMDVAKKVQSKVMKEKMVIPQRSDEMISMNVDSIQTGIKEALSEIDLVSENPGNMASNKIVDETEKVEDVDKMQ